MRHNSLPIKILFGSFALQPLVCNQALAAQEKKFQIRNKPPTLSKEILKSFEEKPAEKVTSRSHRDLSLRMKRERYVEKCMGGLETFFIVNLKPVGISFMDYSYISIFTENILYVYNVKEKKERAVVLDNKFNFVKAIVGNLSTGVGSREAFPVSETLAYFRPMIYRKNAFWEAAPSEAFIFLINENTKLITKKISILYPESRKSHPCEIPSAWVNIEL